MPEALARKLSIVFMGTSELARVSLLALAQSPEFALAAVATQPDRPSGRALRPQPSPVKQAALELGLPTLQPDRARDPSFLETLRPLRPDFIVVAAYGQILPKAILDLPAFGSVNVHASLLPKYRGAAPIAWAILDDEPQTGVTIMKMAPSLDTGDILSQRATPITADDTAATLHDRLAEMGAQLLVPTLLQVARGEIAPRPQNNAESSYARKLAKEDGRLDWPLPARTLWNRVRALNPWPGAFTIPPAESGLGTIKIRKASLAPERSGLPGLVLNADKTGIEAGCGEGALRIEELQLEGGKVLTAAQFLAGHPLTAGQRLG